MATRISKHELSAKLRILGQLVQLNGENPFKAGAYEKVADAVDHLQEEPSIDNVFLLSGVGVNIGAKLREFLATGTCKKYEELHNQWGKLLNLMRMPGIGPVKARFFYQQYEATTREDIKRLVEKGLITDKRIVEGLTEVARIPFSKALSVANILVMRVHERAAYLSPTLIAAGSLRRKKESVKDLDFIVTVSDRAAFFGVIKELFESVSSAGDEKIAGLYNDIHCDIRYAEPEFYGAMLLHFTGSKEHNIKLRQIAIEKGMKLNEYGLWRGEERIAGVTEESIFAALGLPFKTPEER